MPQLFRIIDEYSVEQYKIIRAVLKQFENEGIAMIAYQSNWYVTVACIDIHTANLIRYELKQKTNWVMEIRPGKKNKVRHYINIKLLRK